MPEIEEFLPVFPEEAEDSVMSRMLSWLNEGIDPADPAWLDPREGGMAHTLLVPAAREMATLYDRVSVEFPAAATPLFAWGWYLDQWAVVVGLLRLPATAADGVVRFTGQDGLVIPEGTEVGTQPESPNAAAPSYETAEDVTIAGGVADVIATATEAGLQGNVPANAVIAILSDVPTSTPPIAVNNAAAMSGGSDVETDEALRGRVLAVYSNPPGGGNVADYIGWVRAVPGVGGVSIVPEGQGPGTVVVLATAADGSPASLATREAIRDYLDPPAIDVPMSSVTSTTITVADTTGFRTEGIIHVGTLANERIHNYTGLSATQFTGVTPAPSMNAGDHVWQTGRGGGRAPIGHHVIVGTSVAFNVAVHSVVEVDPGYVVGTGTGVDLEPAMTEAVRAYIDSLPPGAEVIIRRVEAAMLGVEGVYDLSGTTLNGTANNVTAPGNGIPTLTTVDLVMA